MASKRKEETKLSIVIPVYNEGKVIAKTIKGIKSTVKFTHELLIVFDMNEDNTIPPVNELSRQYKSVKLVKNIYGRGALNAIKTGLSKAKSPAVCVMMADLTDDPKTLLKMMEKFDEGYDVISGSRYMSGGHQKGGPIVKQILSRVADLTLHHFVGLPTHDATNSFRLYSKRFLEKTEIESSGGFELGIELTVKAHFGGWRVGEVPTTWTYLAKESRFRLIQWLPNYLKWYLLAYKKKLQGYPKK